MDKVIYFRNKEYNLTLPLDYIRANKEKTITMLVDVYGMERVTYKAKEIPTHEDWEVEIQYFTNEEISEMYRRISDKIFEKVLKMKRRED